MERARALVTACLAQKHVRRASVSRAPHERLAFAEVGAAPPQTTARMGRVPALAVADLLVELRAFDHGPVLAASQRRSLG